MIIVVCSVHSHSSTIMSAVTLSSLSLAFQEIVVPWLVAHHVFDVTVNQSFFDCRKDATLLNNVTLQIVDFIVTILYPPKFWRFLSMLYEKYELTKKVGDASICLRRSVMRRMRGLR